MNITLATLVFLAVSCDEDYADDDENKPKNENVNENEPVDYDIDRPPAATK
jgi:hypothetical protein